MQELKFEVVNIYMLEAQLSTTGACVTLEVIKQETFIQFSIADIDIKLLSMEAPGQALNSSLLPCLEGISNSIRHAASMAQRTSR